MEASGQTGPAEGTGSMPEGEVSGAMTAPAETTPVVPEGPNTTTTSFFTPPMDPSRLADHLFDPVSGVRVDSRGQRIPPGMVPQIVFDPTLGRPVQIGWIDPQFQRQDVPVSPEGIPIPLYIKTHVVGRLKGQFKQTVKELPVLEQSRSRGCRGQPSSKIIMRRLDCVPVNVVGPATSRHLFPIVGFMTRNTTSAGNAFLNLIFIFLSTKLVSEMSREGHDAVIHISGTSKCHSDSRR